jgi:hypothetical protein
MRLDAQVGALIFAALMTAPIVAQAQSQPRFTIAIEVDQSDAAASRLASALRNELSHSVSYRLADASNRATLIIHLVGLAIAACRPQDAIAVSYVNAPSETHLGTAVLVTTPPGIGDSAHAVLVKLAQMTDAPAPR